MKEFIQPIAKRRLSDDVVNQLKTMIVEHNLKSGDKLPPERELSALFQVGRPSIREAIRTLDIMGRVDIRPGQGIFVKEPDTDFYLKAIQETLTIQGEMEKQTLLEILDLRTILERHTAALAARNANEEDLAQIEEAFGRYEQALQEMDLEALTILDFEFHKAVAVAAHHNVLSVMIIIIEDLVKRTMRKFLLGTDMEANKEEYRQVHQDIMEAIKAHSEERAGQAMEFHLRRALEETIKFMDDQ